MHSTHLFALALTALTLGGCGNNLCDRLAKDAEACGETISEADQDQCNEGLSECSKDDEKKLDDMFDCFDEKGFFECDGSSTGTSSSTSGSSTGFEDFAALMECAGLAAGISTECQQSMDVFGSGSTSSTSTFGTTTYTTR